MTAEHTWASMELLEVIEAMPYHELFIHSLEELMPRGLGSQLGNVIQLVRVYLAESCNCSSHQNRGICYFVLLRSCIYRVGIILLSICSVACIFTIHSIKSEFYLARECSRSFILLLTRQMMRFVFMLPLQGKYILKVERSLKYLLKGY